MIQLTISHGIMVRLQGFVHYSSPHNKGFRTHDKNLNDIFFLGSASDNRFSIISRAVINALLRFTHRSIQLDKNFQTSRYLFLIDGFVTTG